MDAPMLPETPTAVRLKVLENGWVPIPVTSPDYQHPKVKSPGKQPFFGGWNKVTTETVTSDMVRGWATGIQNHLNTGLICGAVAAVDIDVPMVALAQQVEALAVALLGPTPLVRIGRAPKFLLCYRAAVPLRKMETPELFLPDGAKVQVEVLGVGQQFVAYGTHPVTRQPYTWRAASPETVPLAALPVVTEAALRGFLAAAEALLRGAGGRTEGERRDAESAATGGPKTAAFTPAKAGLASGSSGARPAGSGFFREVNAAALADLAAWVPRIFRQAELQPGTGAYRVSSADLGRGLQEDLGIHPTGVQDFGERRGLSPIDVTLEFGGAPDAQAAALALCEWIGRDPASLGWRGKRHPGAAPSSNTPKSPPEPIDFAQFRLDLLTAGEPPPRQFLLAPLMPLGTLGLLFGPGGVGKSLAALDLCLAVAQRSVMPAHAFLAGPLGGHVPASAGGASVFLTLEDDAAEVHRRTASLDPEGRRAGLPCYVIAGLDLPGFDPTLVAANGRAAVLTDFAQEGLDHLLDDVARASGHPVRLLVLDPAGDFLSGDENDARDVKPLMRRLREIASRHGCTILLLGHTAKSIDVENPTMRGSGAWVANSRFALALWRPALEETKALASKVGVTADALVWANLVKANHAGAPIGRRRLFKRDHRTGRLHDITADLPADDIEDEAELLDALVAACRDYADAGLPFAYSGVAGLWNGRADLPPMLEALQKHRLEALGTTALSLKRLVKTRTTLSQGAPKYLDVPDGPLALGKPVPDFQGSRREALARRAEAAAI